MSFWNEDCPSRGPGLRHAHSTSCLSTETHPGTQSQHFYDQCCHCLQRGQLEAPEQAPATPAPEEQVSDHLYVPTIAGRCGRHGCGKHQVAHPTLLRTGPDKLTDCDVDHASLKVGLLIADEGQVWSTCPRCSVMVEPKLALSHPVGPPYGKGRLPFTNRHWADIIKLKAAFEGGYYGS